MRKDWISPWWQAALLPESWDVCGIAVPSLSVWHTFALENVGNRYLCGGDPDKDDAASLFLFAARNYQDGRNLFFAPRYRARAMRKIHRRLCKLDWSELNTACQDYVDTCMRSASRWQKGDGRAAGVPYQWHIVRALSASDPSQLDAAWNTSYAVARALLDAYSESKGDASVMSAAAQEMEDNWEDYEDVEGVQKIGIN